jgi:hypothetical protein
MFLIYTDAATMFLSFLLNDDQLIIWISFVEGFSLQVGVFLQTDLGYNLSLLC